MTKTYQIDAFILWFAIAGKINCFIDGRERQIKAKSFANFPNNVKFSIEGRDFIKKGQVIEAII